MCILWVQPLEIDDYDITLSGAFNRITHNESVIWLTKKMLEVVQSSLTLVVDFENNLNFAWLSWPNHLSHKKVPYQL